MAPDIGFASLRDLPDLERLKAERLLQRDGGEAELDSALGLADGGEEIDRFPGDADVDEAETI